MLNKAFQLHEAYLNNLDRVGKTPTVQIKHGKYKNLELFIKLEGENPTGSIKDRTALGIIKNEIKKGNLTKGKTIIDASSGSYGCSISYIGKILGFPVKVVSGSKLTEDKKNFIEYFGAELTLHGDFTIQGNKYCKDIYEKAPDKYCFLDQLHNWVNPQTHFQTTGPEILGIFPNVTAVVFSLGSGGTLNGVSKYIKFHNPTVKIVAVTASSGTKIPGTGAFIDGDYITPFIQELYELQYLDHIAEINIETAIEGVKELRSQGFYVGIQTGAVYSGMIESIHRLKLTGQVVMISGDSGWKNSDKLMKI